MTNGTDHDGIHATVTDYLEGMIRADLLRLRRSFHPAAQIVGHMAGRFTTETVEQFIAAVAEAGGLPERVPLPAEILMIDIAGDAALAKVENSFAGLRYTDYLCLLRIADRWLIVHKTYQEWGPA
jgi:hypothetical protein